MAYLVPDSEIGTTSVHPEAPRWLLYEGVGRTSDTSYTS
ncbi:hypothetical protein CTA1_10821 [Colletotrichum tanaceti]|uniref:Uncharacterized protein n=1 Tax=Colletotrichum tanaceti TaxID=1306861 RepID=A0A4U6WY67_9PEZI|nr:hypothetical protein CTA1_10821 [Colletotrichum tanaceti]